MFILSLASGLQILFITSFGEKSHVVEDVDAGVELREDVGERVEVGVEIGVDVRLLHRALQRARPAKLVTHLTRWTRSGGVKKVRKLKEEEGEQ